MCVNPISTLAVRGGRDVMGIGLLIVLNFKLIFCPTLILFSQLVNHNLVVNRPLSPFHNGLEHFLQDFISLTVIPPTKVTGYRSGRVQQSRWTNVGGCHSVLTKVWELASRNSLWYDSGMVLNKKYSLIFYKGKLHHVV